MQAPFVREIMQEGMEQGPAKGCAEGQQLEALRLAARQLRRRFGTLAPETEAALEALSLEQLEALGDALLDFQTPADLRAWLRAAVRS